jgi:hypothetical protein
VKALDALTRYLLEQGVNEFREAVVPPSRYAALFKLEEDELAKLLVAAANPADPSLYLDPTRRPEGLRR